MKQEQQQETKQQQEERSQTFWRGSLLARLTGRRVPQLLQMSAVECGAACLAMILSYYGRKTSIAEIRDRCGIGRDGLTARSIVQAARGFGLRVRGLSLPVEDFRYILLPAIVHWEFNHFVVVERWSERSVDIVDPAAGRKRLTAQEFSDGFTGVAITLEPGVQFERRAPKPAITLSMYVKHYLKQSPYVLLQILIVSLLLQAFGLILPLFTKIIVDDILPHHLISLLPLLGIGMLILLVTETVVLLLRSSLLVYLQTHLDVSVSSNFFEHLLQLPQQFFQVRSSGDLLERVASNSTIRDLVSAQLISTLLDGSLVVVYLVILLSQSTIFTVTVLLIGLVQILILLFTQNPINILMSRELDARGKVQGYVAEMLTGIETLKAAGAEQRAFQQWSNLYLEELNIVVRYSYLSAVIGIVLSTISALSPIVILWVGAAQVLNGNMQLGTMLALNALAGAFLGPLTSLAGSWQQLQVVNSHLRRVSDVLGSPLEQDVVQVQQPPRLTGHIALEHVSFRYDPQGPLVLKDIELQIEPGQKIALVGRTGSGKTTLGKLLLGLYLPTEGMILYDGIPLTSMDFQQVRTQFGTVMQDARIFSGTVRQNITLNNPDMDMEQILRAAQLAALHEDISQWPMGYETFVSEGGSALSGGQRQRLALARALASKPSILLLDEATSALDVVTERAIEQNLKELACTQIIIAHRLSTICNADQILVLDEGKIVERGTHQQLLAYDGYYARLIQQQITDSETQSI